MIHSVANQGLGGEGQMSADTSSISATNISAERTAEVLVIGGGLAGFSATIEAARSGTQVLLIEKQPAIGGSTIISGGSFAFADTDEQRAAGFVDSSATLKEDLLRVGEYANDPRVVDAYVAHQAETYRWLKQLGVRFGSLFAAGGQSVPRSHRTDPLELMRLLRLAAEMTGKVTIECGCRALRFITDGTSVVLATYCGLAVDGGMRVLDVFDAPIPRLFAAGEVVGGLHGGAYMSSSANGKAAIFGRLAGRAAARERAR